MLLDIFMLEGMLIIEIIEEYDKLNNSISPDSNKTAKYPSLSLANQQASTNISSSLA